MDFIFGLAIGFTIGFLVKHCIEVWDKPMVGEASLPINEYTSEEGDYRDNTD